MACTVNRLHEVLRHCTTCWGQGLFSFLTGTTPHCLRAYTSHYAQQMGCISCNHNHMLGSGFISAVRLCLVAGRRTCWLRARHASPEQAQTTLWCHAISSHFLLLLHAIGVLMVSLCSVRCAAGRWTPSLASSTPSPTWTATWWRLGAR